MKKISVIIFILFLFPGAFRVKKLLKDFDKVVPADKTAAAMIAKEIKALEAKQEIINDMLLKDAQIIIEPIKEP